MWPKLVIWVSRHGNWGINSTAQTIMKFMLIKLHVKPKFVISATRNLRETLNLVVQFSGRNIQLGIWLTYALLESEADQRRVIVS